MEFLALFGSLLVAALIAAATKKRSLVEYASLVAAIVVFAGSSLVAYNVATVGDVTALSLFSVDAFGALMMLIITCIGLATVAYSIRYLRKETEKEIIGLSRVKQYFVLLNLFLAAMILAVTTSSPILAWISIELTTLSTAFLISFYNKPSAMEAAWKYLIINSIGLLLGFFGTLLYYTATSPSGGDGFATWNDLLSNAALFDPSIAKIAFVFVLIGYGTKIGLVPMHTWLPDAHSKAPAPISALLSGVLLNVAFLTMLRFKIVTDAAIGPAFAQHLLIAFGLLSILIASLIIFTQKNYKRLLAYSSIENMGMAALGFGLGGLGAFAAVLHLLFHSLIKSALFLSAGNIFLRYSSTKIQNVRGLITALPVTGVLFLVGFFAITGAPPFGIFLTKLYIFTAGMSAHPFVTAVAILLTAILFIGFFRHASDMAFGERPPELKPEKENVWLVLPPLALLVVVTILSLYQPPFLQTLIENAASHYSR